MLRYDIAQRSVHESSKLSNAFLSIQTELLIKQVEKQGHNWQSIVNSHFPGRTALSARNQYTYACRRSSTLSQPSTPSSNISSRSPRPRNHHSSNGSGRTASSIRSRPLKETDMESEMDESDFDNYELSEEEDGDDWPLNYAPLHQDSANDNGQATTMDYFNVGSQNMPMMEMDTLRQFTTPNRTPQSVSLDQFFHGQSMPDMVDSQMYLPMASSDSLESQVERKIIPWTLLRIYTNTAGLIR